MYDEETGFYYLRSRYYDPSVGRFLNADGLVSTGTGLSGYNMFAYCNDNPINLYDPYGYFSLLACIAGATINLASSYLGAVVTGQDFSWSDAFVAAASGAICCAFSAGKFLGGLISGV